ncbi:ubiquinone biosynthesis protein COQ9 precursor [Metarhizium album ARSEF 1941]|uniref:Ubiquinone biosynthesis protein COQ9 n=1 Tax=Metarhizium album (strain ARSEF 1941) TaxID=1081103 RepID=A0A0B2X6K2_METAS|nr:ubiquinone biosynthesis protein COQ9 precursor [Metarhizium album ARSEF 1941]KHO01100.1 ubiquinone biosynthesis protein COQ9 precursor [Metarhizium album ARSEF 1941]
MPTRPVLFRIARLAHTPRNACFVRANFHSYEHPPSANSFGDVENAILSAAYQHVPEHGFSHRALSLGARDAGYLDISPSALSDGVFSLIRFHLVRQRLDLANKSRQLFDTSEDNISGQGVGFKIAALAWARLAANKDIIHKWQEV